MVSICAGVTLYYPNDSDLENLYNYSKIFDQLYIYDNTPKNELEMNLDNITVLSSGKNDGLGAACSELCNVAKKNSYKYIMLFDQDSRISKQDLHLLFKFIDSQRIEAWIYTPQVVYDGMTKQENNIFEYVNWCITSGSVINLEEYGIKYAFDQQYYIDRLDKDLCQQVLQNGGKICQFNNASLFQKLGEKSAKGYYMHQSFRHYYIARNRLYYNKKFSISYMTTVLQTIKHIYCVIRFEDEKINKIKMIKKGITDYKKGIMGIMP